MTDDMTEFIRARLDEDEQAARALGDACRSWNWSTPPGGYPQTVSSVGLPFFIAQAYDGPQHSAVTAPFIARHDPARVLRAVAAKRAIVDECREAITTEASEADVLGWAILRQLASEWSTHPDYEAGWAP